jgi:hypothetical protein
LKNLWNIVPNWFRNSDLDLFSNSPNFDNQSFISCLFMIYAMLWVLKAATRQQLYSRAKILANEPAVKDAIGGPKDFMYAPIHKIPKHDSMPNKGKSNHEKIK